MKSDMSAYCGSKIYITGSNQRFELNDEYLLIEVIHWANRTTAINHLFIQSVDRNNEVIMQLLV